MLEITRVGVDLAKNLIQVHAVDQGGQPQVRRAIARGRFVDWCAKLPAGCLVVMEACSGAHHWARRLGQLGLQVRLIAPHLVPPYRPQEHAKDDSVADFSQFRTGAQFAAWLGLTPSQHSSGGKTRLGGITKQGDAYLRMLLVQGAKAAIHRSKPRQERVWLWVQQLSERVGWQKAAVALAAKNARILWAMFTRGQPHAANHVSIKPA